MINWTVRFKNKNFWLAFIPAILLFIQAIGKLIGFQIEIGEIQENLLNIVNTLFVVLTILGVVTDPTTEGTTDSIRVMSYTEPLCKAEEFKQYINEPVSGDTQEIPVDEITEELEEAPEDPEREDISEEAKLADE